MKIRLETDALRDATDALLRIAQALPSLHGEPFRALERRLQALEAGAGVPPVVVLPGGYHVATPPAEWTAIIKEATRLGVI